MNSIKTPLSEKPKGRLVLRKTFGPWSAGTAVDLIEYCDTRRGQPTAALVRINRTKVVETRDDRGKKRVYVDRASEQLTIPLEFLVERRS